MATRTATPAASGAAPLSLHAGLNTKAINYTADTDFEASATTVLLAKIPNGARVVDVRSWHTTNTTTAPIDVGIGTDTNEFIDNAARGSVNRATTGIIRYKVSVTPTAAAQYEYLKAVITPSSAASTVILDVAVDYLADGQ